MRVRGGSAPLIKAEQVRKEAAGFFRQLPFTILYGLLLLLRETGDALCRSARLGALHVAR